MPVRILKRSRGDHPSRRGLVWSFLAGAATAVIIGFWGLGWHTAGGTTAMVRHAANDARVKLASAICVERFLKAPNAAAELAALKKADVYARDRIIETGGWVTFARLDVPVFDAAGPCADTLLKMKAPGPTKSTDS